jgi:2-amino-4-hydroxy-6-hydroxymethyldihydropteridine diphosphokinase
MRSSGFRAIIAKLKPDAPHHPGAVFDGAGSLAFLSLGSNIEPAHHLRTCLACLHAQPEWQVEAVSSWYRTAPWGGATDAEFLNLAVALRTRLSAAELLVRTQHIETALGRERRRRYGARTLDIDVLLFGEEIHREAQLQIPHPGLLERDFMLIPLLEIAPELRHPQTHECLAEACDSLRYHQIIDRYPAPV